MAHKRLSSAPRFSAVDLKIITVHDHVFRAHCLARVAFGAHIRSSPIRGNASSFVLGIFVGFLLVMLRSTGSQLHLSCAAQEIGSISNSCSAIFFRCKTFPRTAKCPDIGNGFGAIPAGGVARVLRGCWGCPDCGGCRSCLSPRDGCGDGYGYRYGFGCGYWLVPAAQVTFQRHIITDPTFPPQMTFLPQIRRRRTQD